MHSKAAFVILLLSVYGQLATAQKLAIGPDTKLPPHPRILLLKGEETALKKAVLADKPATVRWTMLTPTTVTVLGGNRAELTKDGQKLTLEVVEPAGVTLKT